MSVGTATAIALASSAAASAYAAHAQASGAKKAAKIQADASDKAMGLQSQLANRAIDAQNQMMYGGTGGTGMPGQGGGGPGGGGIMGMYAPYTNSAPATLSALHEYLGIPGAQQSQTAVPYGGYGQPMRGPQFGGGPMSPGSPAMSYQQGGFQGAPYVPMPQPGAPMAPTGQPFRPRVGPGQQPNQIPMSALYRQG
jgi:hypothetical protein